MRIVGVVLILLVVLVGIPSFRLYVSAKKALADGRLLSADIKAQNLDAVKLHLGDVRSDLKSMAFTLNVFRPISLIPVIGWYYSDIDHAVNAAISAVDAGNIITDSLTPYADLLGLKGTGTFLGGTAQERLQKAIQTLDKVTPRLSDVGQKLQVARRETDHIASWRYPNFLPGQPGKKVDAIRSTIDQTETLIVDAKPVLESLPAIMGEPNPKHYLVLFQNDGELRPSGGFITAYAYFKLDHAKIVPEGSSDIYDLDASLSSSKPLPAPLAKYLPLVYKYNLRDSNLSPDFKDAMLEFESLYRNTAGRKDIDGIVALDTQALVSLVDILGPISSGGVTFNTGKIDACDCPQVIYELEYFAGRPSNVIRSGRKDIIGILMQGIMDKALTAKKDKWPKLIETGLGMFNDKHALAYFHDDKAQAAMEKVNFAGRIKDAGGDYLHINDANFAGAKVNLYLQQTVNQKIEISSDGTIAKTVTIIYKNPRRGDNCELERTEGICLSGFYRDWVRVYVPKGSKLVESKGSLNDTVVGEDFGKTVFEGFVAFYPQHSAQVTFKYILPFKYSKGDYAMLIQKQPGTEGRNYQIEIKGKKQKPFVLDTDKDLKLKI